MTNKADLQKQVEGLQKEIEQYKQANNRLQSDNQSHLRNIESLKDTTSQQDKRLDGLNVAVSEYKKEADIAKKQAAGYKQELDGLSDTKAVLDNLMSILRSPHNDYQKVVNELNDMLQQERTRADDFQRDFINAQCDLQRIQFLEGKVQAYEAMLRVNPVRAEWGEIERGEIERYKMPIE